MNPTLLHTLDEQPLTVIGDIHGESQALDALLDHLQKNPETRDRLMVFIGDLCDRGPDSVGVIRRVRELVEQGRALAILGNHEINLLANDAKDGSGWFFDSRESSDTPFYAPFSRASARERPEIRDFLCSLPLAIRMPGLRIVHAAWDPASIQTIAGFPLGNILELIREQELNLIQAAKTDDLHARYRGELDRWGKQLEDPNDPPPYLDAVADYESLEQRLNPIKRLTSGIEARSPQPFFSGNRWRYSDRTAWWDQDDDPTPVLIGHYWRLFEPPKPSTSWRYGRLFEGVAPVAWHGRHRQAFCIDYSVGARWRTRKFPEKNAENRYRLAAMLWPERILVFDDGARIPTLDTAGVA
ncbi:metallophosphoesterase [Castellaniella ginsengisoli]|uniref:Metallophosphoesterase n=1 Tax=Castellaniella ginsengisoli TaxID=546114 RepID=A0AB39CQ91_9BURK